MRAGPGAEYELLGSVSSDEVLILLGQAFDCEWYYVQRPDGTMGWISGVTATTALPCDQIEEAEIPPTPVVEATATRTPVAAGSGSGTGSGGSSSGGGGTSSTECNGYNPCSGHHSIKVNNKTGANVTLYFVGPGTYTITLPPGNGQRIYILPGRYTITVEKCGYRYTFEHQLNSNWFFDIKC
jgi:hypothetical protein